MGMSSEARSFVERPVTRVVSSSAFSADGETTAREYLSLTADRRRDEFAKKSHALLPIYSDLSRKAIMKHLASNIRTRGTARRVRRRLAETPGTPCTQTRRCSRGGMRGKGSWRKRGGNGVERLVEQALFAQASSLRFFPVPLVVRAVGQSE